MASKRTIRAIAEKNGHVLPNFIARRGSDGKILYYVAWCTRCNAAIFSDSPEWGDSPAKTPCSGYTDNEKL